MSRFLVGRAIAVGLTMVATMGAVALATAGTAQARTTDGGLTSNVYGRQLATIADDAAGPLLFYRSGTGSAATGQVGVDGSFADLSGAFGLDPGWSLVVPAGFGRVLFYRSSDGLAALGSVNGSGVFSFVKDFGRFGINYTRAAHLGGGRLFFYRAIDGHAFTMDLDPVTNEVRLVAELFDIDPSWGQVVYVGNGRLLFYRSGTGIMASGVVESNGTITEEWSHQFIQGLTHISYAGAGQILMYRSSDGLARTALVNNIGFGRSVGIRGGLDLGWSSITYVGGGRLLFYRSTGSAATGEVDGQTGEFRNLRTLGLDSGWNRITTPLI